MLDQCFGDYSSVIATICDADRDFPGYLVKTTWGERQFICCVLALSGANPDFEQAALKKLGEEIRGGKRDAVLGSYFGELVPGLARVVVKVADEPLDTCDYLALAHLMGQDRARCVLRFLPNITRSHIKALARLPDLLHRYKVVGPIDSDGDIDTLSLAFALARKGRPEIKVGDLASSIEKSFGAAIIATPDDMEELEEYAVGYGDVLAAWLKRQLARMAVPAAPWPGTERIIPITSVNRMKMVARNYRNCIEDKVADVVAGKVYFYEHTGKPRAIISLERAGVFGWAIGEIFGRTNDSIAIDRRTEIERAFVEAGFLPNAGNAHWEVRTLFADS